MVRALLCLAGVWFGTTLVVGPEGSGSARPLGVQQCDTKCQTVFTDCMIACDGEPKCQSECKAAVERCVAVCRSPVQDAGGVPDAKPPGDAGSDATLPDGAPDGAPRK